MSTRSALPPTRQAATGRWPVSSTGTGWHQDWPNLSHDRVGFLTLWIALHEITPEHGSLRFLTGSQSAGPLGRSLRRDADLVTQYPGLATTYGQSPPLHYAPGDATIHDGLTVHSAVPNHTDESRWAYALGYYPDDVRYNGAQFADTDDLGLAVGDRIDHARFPLVTD